MKKHICALLCALLLLGGTVPAASALEGESLRAADTLAALGIVRGDYALDTPATYTHAAVLLVRLAGAEPAEPAPGTDAPAGTPLRSLCHQPGLGGRRGLPPRRGRHRHRLVLHAAADGGLQRQER